ncbi:MAG: acetylxylan esterase [Terrimicrobiaceae bacterium]
MFPVAAGFFRIQFSLLALGILSACAQDYAFDIRQNHLDGVYQAGEQITFKVRLLEDGAFPKGKSLRCILYHNLTEVRREDFPADAEVRFSTRMEQPGWCQLTVVALDSHQQPIFRMEDGKKSELLGYSGAVVDPLKVRQGAPEPKDFDAFWAQEKEKLTKFLPEASRKPVPNTPDHMQVFYVQAPVGSGFRPMQGVLKMPAGAKPKSLPVFLHVQGAGVHVPADPFWQPPLPEASGIREPVIFLNLNAHGLPGDQPEEYYNKLRTGELKDYHLIHNQSPEQYYMKGMILRLKQALSYLKTLPEWNGRDIVVSGGSQGGAQALMAGGLDTEVTFVYADIPAMCDLGASLAGRAAGWPKLYTMKEDGTVWVARDSDPRNDQPGDASMITMAGYFDAANFARRIHCQAVLRTGGQDGVCPPTSVFAAYNNIPSQEKQILFSPQGGHARGIYEPTEQQEVARFKGAERL